MKGHGSLPIVPAFSEAPVAMFINRYSEIGWMLLRLLPALQPPDSIFSEAWRAKWDLLDECFEQTVHSLTEQLGKPIGAAVVELVHSKFPFNSRSVFPL
jgi:hypothetical protein